MATLYFISKDLLAFNSSWLHVKKMRTNHQLLQCVPLERAVHLNSARLNKQRKRKKDNFRASNKKLQCTVYEDSLLHRLCVGCGLFDEQNRNAINSMYNLAAHTFHYCFSIIMNCNKITIFFSSLRRIQVWFALCIGHQRKTVFNWFAFNIHSSLNE